MPTPAPPAISPSWPHRTAALLSAAAALVLLATGCDDSTSTDAAPATATAPAVQSPSPSPSSTARSPFAVGTAWKWSRTEGVSGTTTVVGYQQDVAKNGPKPEDAGGSEARGEVWAALEVKLCSDASSSQAIQISPSTWKLAYDDGALVEPSNSGYETFPRPQFPFGGADLLPGRCIAGKIVFPVPGDKKPARVMYSPPALGVSVEWNLPQ
ncbi:hypothetical protein BX265_0507 [Streptomyces sp. TLI_235]|nr:hypothetical protein [Streptomyces sp. TLI_235]PBC75826.1 hypothetical protein BX265_0507 [Streptomyces sp. TLI_235]